MTYQRALKTAVIGPGAYRAVTLRWLPTRTVRLICPVVVRSMLAFVDGWDFGWNRTGLGFNRADAGPQYMRRSEIARWPGAEALASTIAASGYPISPTSLIILRYGLGERAEPHTDTDAPASVSIPLRLPVASGRLWVGSRRQRERVGYGTVIRRGERHFVSPVRVGQRVALVFDVPSVWVSAADERASPLVPGWAE